MDPIQLITHDHRNLERIFKRMERAVADDHRHDASATLRELTRELSVHAAIEEQLLYPALRDAGSDGEILYAVEEHHAAKLTLSELEATAPADPRFATKARLLISNVRQHIEEEESHVLPLLERALGPEQRSELAAALSSARAVSPTRPHPSAPELPPGNLLVGPMIGILDRVRDSVREGLLGARSFARSAVGTAFLLLRRLSTQTERRGREAADLLATRTREVANDVTAAGRRTIEEATGRGAEAARQLRAPARRAQRSGKRRGRASRRRSS